MTRKSLATFMLLAAAPLAVLAAEPSRDTSQGMGQSATSQGNEPPMFKELDKNHDGQISKSEAKRSADTVARFKELDTNHDGKISVAEWEAANKTRGAAGVSGESRDTNDMRSPSSPGSTGETPAPGSSDMNRKNY